MLLEYIKIVATVVVAALGWVVAHHFISQKSRNDKKRDLSIAYLTDAYRFLTTEVVQRDISDEAWARFESVIADVQLFGSPEQVLLVKELVECIVQGGEFELDMLINSLRKDLRRELGLENVSGNVKWFRYIPKRDNSMR